ncbi:MAG: ATP-binding protein, partial [Hyphomicrobiaceae bacterium]
MQADIEQEILFERLSRKAGQLDTVSRSLAALSTAGDISAACSSVCRLLRDLFEADLVELAVIEPDRESPATLGWSRSTAMPLPGHWPAQPLAAVAQWPVLIRDLGATAQEDEGAGYARQLGLRAWMRCNYPVGESRSVLISVGSLVPGGYDGSHLQLIEELGKPIGSAVGRLLDHQRLEESAAVLRAEARILALLRPDTTVEEIATVYVQEARRLFGASHASLIRIPPAGVGATLAGLSSDHLGSAEVLALLAGAELSGLLRPQGAAALVRLSPGDEDQGRRLAYGRGLRTLLQAPIRRSDGSIMGATTLGSMRGDAFRTSDLARMADLARAVGVVVERAELLRETRARAEQVAALSRLMSTMHARAEPHDVAQAFACEVQRSLGADLVRILSFEAEPETHGVIASVPETLESGGAARPPAGSYQWMRAHGTGRYDRRSPAQAPGWLAEECDRLGLGSAFVIRLEANGEPVGMVFAGARAPEALGEDQIAVVNETALPLGMLLERARLVSSLAASTRRTDSILSLLEAVGPAGSLDELASPLATALRHLFRADASAVMMRDARGLRIAAIDSDDPSLRGVRARRELRGEQAWPAKRRVHRNLQSAIEPLDPLARLMRDRGYGACVTVPVGPASPIQCAVTLACRAPGAFAERDGRQLAHTLRPVEVAVAYFAGKREAAERERRLETMNRILGRLARGGNPSALAAAFAQECVDLFGCTAGVVFRQAPDDLRATTLGSWSTGGGGAGLPAIQPLDGPADGIVALSPEAGGALAPAAALAAEMARRSLAEALRVPLLLRGAIWGGVELWALRPGHFTPEDRDLLGALASPLALALEKAMALQALAESELKYRSVVAQAEEMILLLDVETGAILDANPCAAQTLGYSSDELLQLSDVALAMPGSAGFVAVSVEELLDEVQLRLSDRQLRRKDGAAIDVDMMATIVAFGGRRALLVMARDMSERKAMQRQLMQAQKMESLGELAGAVAHDFNNLLTTILGFAGILKLGGGLDEENRENVGMIEDAARRGADLTSRLLSFSRGGLVQYGPVDLRTVVADTLRLAGPTLNMRYRLETSIPDSPVVVEGDEGQLQQAMLNIILNARDAMSQGGTLRIVLDAADGEATLAIADDGPGMDEDVRLRVFEPFFTTKPAGSGTGLGLAITYGIVQGHHGRIRL